MVLRRVLGFLFHIMNVLTIDSARQVAAKLAKIITDNIQENKRILLLVSGGSTIPIAVLALRQLDNIRNLTIMQADERYGPVGHSDSNWQQLLDAGLDTHSLRAYPILSGRDLPDTVSKFEHELEKEFDTSDFKIGLFGIGADGHTAGILPYSSAAMSRAMVTAYQASDFQRITITPVTIAKLDIAIAFAAGDKKIAALHDLQKDLPISKQPAQALKLAGSTYIYNNQKEERR